MKSRICVAIGCIGLLMAQEVSAGDGITVTTDAVDNRIEQAFTTGDIVPVTFFLSSEGEDPVLGVSFALFCSDDSVRIHAVEFSPVFPFTLGGDAPTLPASHYHSTRVRSPAQDDSPLPDAGAPVCFASVELEVLQATPFESDLVFRVRGLVAHSGPHPAPTAAERVGTVGRITIANIGQQESESWDVSYAALAMELRECGGGPAVTTLQAGQWYELHYGTPYGQADDYVLFVVSEGAGSMVAAAGPPQDGPWAIAGNFQFMDDLAGGGDTFPASGYPTGFYRRQMITDFFGPVPADGEPAATGQGCLCQFTPQSPGELNLQLYLSWSDMDTLELVEMQSQGTYAVVPSDASDDGE